MKYTYMTRFSILAIGVIFLLQISQAVLVYRLSQTNVDLLQHELDSITESVYNMYLDFRLGAKAGNDVSDIKLAGTTTTSDVDTTKIELISPSDTDTDKKRKEIDSLAAIVFKKNDIKLKFYSEIVDASLDKVPKTSLYASFNISDALYSKKIPLDLNQTKALRLVFVNPMWNIYSQMALILIFSLLLSILCIHNLYVQKKNLTREKEFASMKNDFFSEVSHEFKKPLAVLYQTFISLGNETILEDREKRARMLRIGNEEVEKMTGRTEIFLSLAQDDEGLFELHYTEFDLVKIVFDLADKVVDITPGSPEIDVDSELKNPIFFGDKDHIEHLISNLIDNAIKYSRTSIDIHIKLYNEGDNVCISVKDTGVGISAENTEVIFERYSRVGKPTHAKGHGIGLNYVKRIAEKHGGSVSVVSELNVGSEFIVKLPLVKNA